MAATKGQLVLLGYHVPKGKANDPNAPREFVAYPVDWPAIADNGVAAGKMQVDAEMDFVWLETTHSNSAGTGHVPLKVQMTPVQGRPVFREALYINTFSAPDVASTPKRVLSPTVFKATTSIRFEFTAPAA